MKKILVCGCTGFIGNHLVTQLVKEGHVVFGVDYQLERYKQFDGFFFVHADLRKSSTWEHLFSLAKYDEIYQLAADMGGAGHVFSGDYDADIMHNSALINLNLLSYINKLTNTKIFYSSSACMYPEHNQLDTQNPNCKENSAYPANPDSEYGWEKLFSERLYLSFARNYNLDVSIARFHNIFGPLGSWKDGREKAPAAFCRKVAEAKLKGKKEIEMWGDGEQTRSFLYVDECVRGIIKLTRSDFKGPVNIGSEEMVSINQLVRYIMTIAGVDLKIKHIKGPLGVRGRNSDNELIRKKLNWEPDYPLKKGLIPTYQWIEQQVKDSLHAEN